MILMVGGVAVPLGLLIAARLVSVVRKDLRRIHAQYAAGVIDIRLLAASLHQVLCAGMYVSDVAMVTVVGVLVSRHSSDALVTPVHITILMCYAFVASWSGMMVLIRQRGMVRRWLEISKQCTRQPIGIDEQRTESDGNKSFRERLRTFLNARFIAGVHGHALVIYFIAIAAFTISVVNLFGSNGKEVTDGNNDGHRSLSMLRKSAIFTAMFVSLCSVLFAICYVRRKSTELQLHMHFTQLIEDQQREDTPSNQPPAEVPQCEKRGDSLPMDGHAPHNTLSIPSLSITSCLFIVIEVYSVWVAVFLCLLEPHLIGSDLSSCYNIIWIYSCSNCYWTYLIHGCM